MRYAYGIVRSGHPAPRHRGIGGGKARVTIVEHGPIGAAVSEIAAHTSLDEDDARTHLQVLIDLLADGPVLPVRMGTVFSSDADVRSELLAPMEAEAAARLAALESVVELHVDVDDDERDVLDELARSGVVRPNAHGDLAATVDVGRQIAEVLVLRRREVAEHVLGRLRPLAVDDVPRAQLIGPEDPVLRWAFLVRRDQVPDFDEAIATLRTELPALAFGYVGPLPAAHFADRVGTALDTDASSDTGDAFAGQGRWGF